MDWSAYPEQPSAAGHSSKARIVLALWLVECKLEEGKWWDFSGPTIGLIRPHQKNLGSSTLDIYLYCPGEFSPPFLFTVLHISQFDLL